MRLNLPPLGMTLPEASYTTEENYVNRCRWIIFKEFSEKREKYLNFGYRLIIKTIIPTINYSEIDN